MDYIYVINEKNEKEKMEVVSIYTLPNSSYNYIIYKSLKEREYYIAKYKGENITDLNTDLTEEELKCANDFINRLGENTWS